MNQKNVLRVSIILLIVITGFAHSANGRYDDEDNEKYRRGGRDRGYDDGNRRDRYDDEDEYGRDRYDDDDSYRSRGSKNRNDYGDGGVDEYYGNDKKIIGYEGKDPRRDGIDLGDFGPIFGRNDSMLAKINLWITSADDWEQRGSGKYRPNKYGSNRRGSNKQDSNKYDSDKYDSGEYGPDKKNYKDGNRRKRSYSKVTFPVKHIKNYKKFPFHKFPPLVCVAPWLPIFYDKLTYQTFIFSITGGLYIIPPLINFYGQRFAVAQLIKWGYASLVSSGVPPPPAVNVAPLVQPGPPVPPPAGGKPDAVYKPVKTDFPTFRARPDYLEKAINSGPSNKGPGPYSG